MEWKSSAERLQAYKNCAKQVAVLPDWLQGMTDYFGKFYSPRDHALAFVLNSARGDSYISIEQLTELNEYVRTLPLLRSGLRMIELENV